MPMMVCWPDIKEEMTPDFVILLFKNDSVLARWLN